MHSEAGRCALTKHVLGSALPGRCIPEPDLVIEGSRCQQPGFSWVKAHHPWCAAMARQHALQLPTGALTNLDGVVPTAGETNDI